jgi:ribosomal protein L18
MASMSSTTNGRIEQAADTARDAFEATRESVSEARDAVRKAARTGAKEAAAFGRDGADRAYSAAQDVGQSVAAYIKEKPVHAALIGLGGLMLASMLFRRRS